MAAQIYPFGFRRAENGEKADLTIINTCTVTHRADSDCRYLIRRAVRENTDGHIVVVGCYVEADPERIAAMDGVDVLIHNNEKEEIARILPKHLPDLFSVEPDKGCSVQIEDFHDRNRAWIKISDGCNQLCSYCLVTIVRGRLNNRPAADIIDEINSLAGHGYNEIVLTGVNMGYYHDKQREPKLKNLAALCRMIMSETDLSRMRLSSIEPQAVRDELVEVFAESNGRICRHFHLPLQSGSSTILRRMRRPYNQAIYVKRVSDLKAAVPNATVGGDVIVGFPGETDDDFLQSGRNKILTAISHDLLQQSLQRQVGQTLEVISEHKADSTGAHTAISDNYLKVKLPSDYNSGRAVVKVKITAVVEDHLEGDILS